MPRQYACHQRYIYGNYEVTAIATRKAENRAMIRRIMPNIGGLKSKKLEVIGGEVHSILIYGALLPQRASQNNNKLCAKLLRGVQNE